jgi:hypothetical protein
VRPTTAIERICSIPTDGGPVIGALEQSGYREAPEILTVENVSAVLRKHPYCGRMDPMVRESAFRLTLVVWARRWRILHRIPANGEDYIIADEFHACAEFIVRVVQQLVRLQP